MFEPVEYDEEARDTEEGVKDKERQHATDSKDDKGKAQEEFAEGE